MSLEQHSQLIDQIANGYRGYTAAVSQARDAVQDSIKALNAERSAQRQTGASIGKLLAQKRQLNHQLAEYTKALRKQRIDSQQFQKQTLAAEFAAKGLGEQIQIVSKQLGKMGGAIRAPFNGLMKLTALFGTSAISMKSVIDDTFKYNKAMFELQRSYSVSGRAGQDFAKTLQYVNKNLQVSQVEFLQLAKDAHNAFIGIKPNVQDLAEALEVLDRQTGFNRDSFRQLYQLQSQFPALYDEINKGLDHIKNINTDKLLGNEHKLLETTRARVLALGLVQGASSKEISERMQWLTPLTAAERELNKILSDRAKVHKEVADLQRDLAEQFEPILREILELTIKVVEHTREWGHIIVPVIKAMVAMGTTLKAFSGIVSVLKAAGIAAAALKVPILKIAGPILVIAGLVGKVAYHFGRSQIEAKKLQKEIAEQEFLLEAKKKLQEAIGDLTEEERKRYEELNENIDKANKSEKEILQIKIQNVKQAKEEKNEVALLFQEYEKVQKSAEMQNKAWKKIEESLKSAISLSMDFGLVNKESAEVLIKARKALADVAKLEAQAMAELTSLNLKDMGIEVDIDMNADPAQVTSQINEALRKVTASDLGFEDQRAAAAQLGELIEKNIAFRQREADIIKSVFDLHKMEVQQMEQYTSAVESRLQTEKQLMESAQFGLGASVDMMQRQVDLAYEMMQTYAHMDQQLAKRLISEEKITAEQMERLKSAKSQAEAQHFIENVLGKSGTVAKELSYYYNQHQVTTDKIMKQQLKVYELTKDIREGYLDAIRHMSTGAGEFEKIIGTQEMGVTQLMDVVKDATGVMKLNTMALGGLQDASSQVGTQVAGQYTTGGLSFIGAQEQEARNLRIYRHGESVEEAKRVMRGEMPNDRSRVGDASVPGAERYLAPEREEEIIKNGNYEGTYKALEDFSQRYGTRDFSRIMGTNVGVTQGSAPGREDSRRIQAHGALAGAWGSSYIMRGSYERASGGHTTAPGPMGTPRSGWGATDKAKSELSAARRSLEFWQEKLREEQKVWEKHSRGSTSIGGVPLIDVAKEKIAERKQQIQKSEKTIARTRRLTHADFTKREIAKNRKMGSKVTEAVMKLNAEQKKLEELRNKRDEIQKRLDSIGTNRGWFTSRRKLSEERRQKNLFSISLEALDAQIKDSKEEISIKEHKVQERRSIASNTRVMTENAARIRASGMKSPQGTYRENAEKFRRLFPQEARQIDQKALERQKHIKSKSLKGIEFLERLVKGDHTYDHLHRYTDDGGKFFIGTDSRKYYLDDMLNIARNTKKDADKRIKSLQAQIKAAEEDHRKHLGPADPRVRRQIEKARGIKLREQIGVVKGATAEERAAQVRSRVTQIGLDAGVHKGSREDIKKFEKDRELAERAELEGWEAPEGTAHGAVLHHKRLSKEQRERAIDPQAQAEYHRAVRESDMGHAMAASDVAGGSATIKILLEDGLREKVMQAANVAVEVRRGLA